MIRMRRNVTKDIWRAVVVAGAMIGGATGCGVASAKDPPPADHGQVAAKTDDSDEMAAGKKAPPQPIDAGVAIADASPPQPDAAPPAPDAGVKKVVKPKPKPRPRKDPGDDSPPRGRGFVLA